MLIIIVVINIIIAWLVYALLSDHLNMLKIKEPSNKTLLTLKLPPSRMVINRNFYKIFKYLFIQSDSGIHPEVTIRSIYKVADHPEVKRRLVKFSSLLAKKNQEKEAFEYLNKAFKEGQVNYYVEIMERFYHHYVTRESLRHIDQLLFQKYLSTIRLESKKIERRYIYMVVIYTAQITLFLLLPLLQQMIVSVQGIFA